ncbi:hypothetical protein SJ05684_c18510 [Sinorhizobium sojae CCBAU 05684]|uniref:Uncharacterized protein n=1 Tax=Sinorhizobium sojae CCBAU 05684 TaxID=716928 RepID=A0A249PBJ8_9HYPH|nr:hypothetical protein SJ05684_c18510 [Sinorhizobium sojae CCBAU 05684]
MRSRRNGAAPGFSAFASAGKFSSCLFPQTLPLLSPFGRFQSRRLDFRIDPGPCRVCRKRHRRRLFPDIVTTRRLSALLA